jgi:DNA-binding SARP family transcriptional activator
MRFQLLGLVVVVDGGRRIELVRGKERALLALLLLSANEPVSTDRVIEALWGDRPPEHATKTVQIHVSRLRKRLDARRLTTTPGGYLLRVAPGELDVAMDPPPANRLAELRTRFASQLNIGTSLYENSLIFNTRVAPFNDVRVRRALN